MPTDEIRELFREWLLRTEGDSPSQRLLQELQRIPDADLQELLRESYDRFEPRNPVFSPAQSAQLLAHIRQAIRLQEEEPAETLPTISRPWWRFAAAAAILVLLAGAWFFLSPKHSPAPILAAAEISPGGNKAILTLADGQKIVLDSAHNGQLAQQTGAQIIKSDSGRLAYQPVHDQRTETVFNTLTTPRGGQYQLTLSDGTKVWLNAASSLRYPTAFTGKTRSVEITGEAYFEIAPDPKKPFTVKKGTTEVAVLGTSFNINSYDDETTLKVTLVDGAVKVIHGRSTAILHPGDQARIGENMTVVPDADLEATLAWKNGRFQFQGADIEEVMRQIARWYDVDVEYEGKPKDQHFRGGIPRSASASRVFDMLESTGAVKFKITGKKIIVMP